jgi:hypothetical protein
MQPTGTKSNGPPIAASSLRTKAPARRGLGRKAADKNLKRRLLFHIDPHRKQVTLPKGLTSTRYPLSAIRYPLSAIRYPLSCVQPNSS